MSEQTEEPSQPIWLQATLDDFAATDINAPISGSDSIDYGFIEASFEKSSQASMANQRVDESRAYAMIAAACSFHFKPDDRHEPFGAKWRFGDRRSPIPDDFRGNPQAALAGYADRFSNPAVRGRIGDLVWLLDRSQFNAAQSAIVAYNELVQKLSVDPSEGDDSAANLFECEGYLRRALQIGRTTGWDKEGAKRTRDLCDKLRRRCHSDEKRNDFCRFAELDLEFEISYPANIAIEAESLVGKEPDFHQQHRLLQIAAQAHRYTKNEEGSHRCLSAAAECYVALSEQHSASAAFQSHWLERAIFELSRVPQTKERRRELKHRLIEAQSNIADELSHFSQPMDLTDIAEAAQRAVSKKSFMEAINAFVRMGRSPGPAKLLADAKKSIADHPLQGLFGATIMDSKGKPVHRYGGADDTDGSDTSVVQQQIARSESLRRTIFANGSIEPARITIMAEHLVSATNMELLCVASPFIPPNHEMVFAYGFARFFQGDMIGALRVLVPQLENSLRYVLSANGHDVVKTNNDQTQENLNLSAMLDKLRPGLAKIFGPALVADLDNVFNHRGGPGLRHSVAHGTVSNGEPFGPDPTYACWLIFQICCLPLLRQWTQLTEHYESIFGEA